jgi:hypothetical protein
VNDMNDLHMIQEPERLEALLLERAICNEPVMVDDEFEIVRVLRFLSGRRSTLLIRWQDDYFVAKCFFHAEKKAKDFQAELKGMDLLGQAVKQPEVCALLEHDQMDVILFEYLAEGEDLNALLESDPTSFAHAFVSLLADMQILFSFEVLQQDPHLGNFFWQDESIYWLDAGSVAKGAGSAQQQLSALALLLAQVPLPYLNAALAETERQFACILGVDAKAILNQTQNAKRRRALKHHEKLLRECTEVSVVDKANLKALVTRGL